MSNSDPPDGLLSAGAASGSVSGSVSGGASADAPAAGAVSASNSEVPVVPLGLSPLSAASGAESKSEPELIGLLVSTSGFSSSVAAAFAPTSSVAVTVPAVGAAPPPAPPAAAAPAPDLAAAPAATGLRDSPLTDASSSWATSRTSTSSRAEPSACFAVSPSESITRQNGQPVAIWSAPVSTASVVRLRLIRSPSFSSIHIRAPPAPQQKERSLLRGISVSSASGMTLRSSRGGEYTWLCRPR